MRCRWLLWPVALAAATAAGEQVVRVKDGDSLVVASAGREVDVRLAGIDAPELRQARGMEARMALEAMVAGRDVELQLVGGDAYRRIVAHILVDGLDVNAEMVRRGLGCRANTAPPRHWCGTNTKPRRPAAGCGAIQRRCRPGFGAKLAAGRANAAAPMPRRRLRQRWPRIGRWASGPTQTCGAAASATARR